MSDPPHEAVRAALSTLLAELPDRVKAGADPEAPARTIDRLERDRQ
jgi:hypothetical protein